MSQSELDSFVSKFKFLWHAEYNATLKVETNAGIASITLHAGLGSPTFPFSPPPQHIPNHVPRRSGPAQQRRRKRREAARKAASDARHNLGAPLAEEAEAPTNEQVAEEVTENIINNVDATAEEVGQNSVEKADYFSCELCDSSFKNVRGLRTHEGRAHKANSFSPISQLDGHGEKREEDGINKNDNEDIESSDAEYSCDRCDFVGKTTCDLKTHKSTKHLFGRFQRFSR